MSAKGFLARLAIGTESSFGTAVAVSQILPFTSESLSLEKDKLDDPILTGTSGRLLAETIRQRVSGSIETNLTFGGAFDQVFKAALGSQTSDTTAQTETFDLVEDITTSLTVAIDKQTSIHEFSGCKINQLTISSDGSVLTASLDILGKSRTRNGVNTATEFDNASGYGTRIRHPDIVFKVNGVAVNIASFTLTLNNNLTAIEENAVEPTAIERNGKREVSLSFELARYTTDTYSQNFENDTEFSVEISASNGTDSLTITLPRVIVTNASQPVGGAEIIKQSIECVCLASGTANEMQIVRAY
jgi:hypothetical protein